eukprot:scaffold988_cov105-Isochrysis_galbana.AAC.9
MWWCGHNAAELECVSCSEAEARDDSCLEVAMQLVCGEGKNVPVSLTRPSHIAHRHGGGHAPGGAHGNGS